MFKMAIFYNNYNTLGHTVILFSLIKRLKVLFKDKIRIIIFQIGNKDIPYPLSIYAKIYPISWQGDQLTLNSSRVKFLLKQIRKFQPNVFITEYYPFVKDSWIRILPRVLAFIKDEINCKIIGSYSCLNWHKDAYEMINNFYDTILIHSPREYFQLYHSYLPKEGRAFWDKVIRDLSKKIVYTGFIIDKEDLLSVKGIREKFNLKDRKFILVSRGGGVVGYKRILVALLEIARRNKNYLFLISLGYYIDNKLVQKYKSLYKGITNIKLVRFIYPGFIALLNAADLSISMSGYNTSITLLWLKKKCLFIPHNHSEQKYRAVLMSRYLPCSILKDKVISRSLLENKIKELLNKPKQDHKRDIPKEWFDGLDQTVDFLKKISDNL